MASGYMANMAAPFAYPAVLHGGPCGGRRTSVDGFANQTPLRITVPFPLPDISVDPPDDLEVMPLDTFTYHLVGAWGGVLHYRDGG